MAAALMLKRRGIRARFIEWVKHCGFEPAAHHRLLIEKLEAVARGEIQRLAVFMPPGSAKSTYASVLFPPWLLQARRGWNVLAASHTTELAEKWGRRVRNLIADNSPTLDLALSADSTAAGRWALTSKSEYYAAGVGTGIAGFRANLGIIDDPIRSRQDADSDLIRDRVWDWYINDFRTRLVPGAAEILIQTRWHEDDLAGRALNHQKWDTVSLPAIAMANDPLGRKPGEPLWADDAYGYGAQLTDLSTSTPPRTWNALYQQDPTPDDGTFFKNEWLGEYTEPPPHLYTYGASDFAVTDGDGDFTEHGVFGVDHAGNVYALDWWRGQTTADVWIEKLCDSIVKHKPLCWFGESGPIRRSIEPFLMKRMQERGAYSRIEWLASIHDKPTRARSIQALASMGKLWLPKGAEWVPELRKQMVTFPAGRQDDGVDVLSLLGRGLEFMGNAAIPSEPEPGYSGPGAWLG
jgi:predicted phage terminase large subunit-like protein